MLLVFEYLFLIRKVHFEEATGVGVMCVGVCVCGTQASKRQRVQGEKWSLSHLRTGRPVYS